jgi:hypothetical protein
MRYKIRTSYVEQGDDEYLVEAASVDDALNIVAGDDSADAEIIDVKNVWVGERTQVDPPTVEEV